jgi:CubicO group peptidase (beta-lactamase class C family)
MRPSGRKVVPVTEGPVEGYVAPGFERVAAAFVDNFATGHEVGAAFAATQGGEPVVDLWGGFADEESGRPWRQDTLQLVFSATKGFVALCVAMLLDRGVIRLDDPVSRHWPEFAANGKQEITVAEVMSHRARLPAVRTPVDESEFLDQRQMAARRSDDRALPRRGGRRPARAGALARSPGVSGAARFHSPVRPRLG